MTRVDFIRRGGRFCGLVATGHSGYGEAGSDIVCAAVSTAVGMAEIAIRDVAKVPASVEVDEETATVRLLLPDSMTAEQRLVCESALQSAYLELRENAGPYRAYLRVRQVNARHFETEEKNNA